jgi:LPXTG-motif cell wall-anchored protein
MKDTTEVVTYQIDLEKVDTSNAETKLAGAKFKLYDQKTGGKEIPVVLVPLNVAHPTTTDINYGKENSKVDNVYRHAKTGETGVEMVTGATGKIIVQGLANGNYYFEETEAPKGFNKLTARTDATTIKNKNASIKVLNESGAELPSTGGIGTTIFYVVGAILVIGAGVVLVTRRRMNVQ